MTVYKYPDKSVTAYVLGPSCSLENHNREVSVFTTNFVEYKMRKSLCSLLREEERSQSWSDEQFSNNRFGPRERAGCNTLDIKH